MSAGQKRVQFSIQHYPPETKRWPKIICCLKIWAVSARNSRRDTTGLWCKQFFIFHVVKLCAYYPCGCLASSRSIFAILEGACAAVYAPGWYGCTLLKWINLYMSTHTTVPQLQFYCMHITYVWEESEVGRVNVMVIVSTRLVPD